MKDKLLTRDKFREAVFNRDGHKCLFCDRTDNLDSHHLTDRRLFSDGRYYISNGGTVCPDHHMKCETTEISVDDVRRAANIGIKTLPEHLYDDQEYDKWGNPILANGQRLKGELFYDESVQKVLKQGGMLDRFTNYVKYSRTYHCPWSEGMNDDDKMMKSMDEFIGKRVIVTTKMDGESFSGYSDYCHARSLDSRNHPSRDWAKQFWSTIQHNLPEGYRVCAENMYAVHSIKYDNLKSYLLGFSIWNERNICLSWDETLEWFELLGITPVEVLYDGIYDETKIKALWNPKNSDKVEGYVIRIADSFSYGEFRKKVAKFVRRNHITTVKHWMFGQQMGKNTLENNE